MAVDGITATYISANQFSVSGDQTDSFHAGRRVRAELTSGYVYSTISGSVYTSVTTVTLYDSELDDTLTKVWYGIGWGSEGSLPDHTHDGSEGSGDTINHDNLVNTHNLTTDIDHDALTNTHNLTTDIDHDSLLNTHNLTTDIDHDALTNFVAAEHIDWSATGAETVHTDRILGPQSEIYISGDAGLRLIRNPGGGYVRNNAFVTGAIKITLPFSWTDTLLRLRVIGYNHDDNSSWEVLCGGYLRAAFTEWWKEFARVFGNAPFSRVRFGHDGSKCCIILGETDTDFDYPQIAITEFLAGYDGVDDGWETGWSIDTEVTDLSSITFTGDITNKVWEQYNDGSGSGLDADLLDGVEGSGYMSSTSPQLGGDLDLNGNNFDYGSILTDNQTYEGDILTVTVDTNSIGFGGVLAQAADFHYDDADADAAATSVGIVMAVEAGTGSKKVLLRGQVCDTSWNWSAGYVYLSTTAGELTQTAPSGSGDQVMVLGWALSADTIWFEPTRVATEVA